MTGVSALFVCTANICRSPTLAFMAGQSGAVRATSAGMRARSGSAMCRMAALSIASFEGGQAYAESFRSRTVQGLDVNEFDLVFTATRAMRAELIRSNPLLRGRIFTVREAAALGQYSLTAGEAYSLLEYGPATVLAARRGSVAAPRARSRWVRDASDPFDLPDAHNDRREKRHRATVRMSLDAGAELGAALLAWHAAAPGLAESG
ncbi:hypothetical protein [Microbacterium sp. STN6]|uniref:arsenate reductase/protein-tyrosine-phosphatase family protein n=1 Tax=Microbacterium sp. STN6 TaxID=2995588 RepID=UPI003A5994A1